MLYRSPVYPRPFRVLLRRGVKEQLESENEIYAKYRIIAELPDEFSHLSSEELMGKKVKYKIGDGKTPYKDLPYEDGEIPVGFYV